MPYEPVVGKLYAFVDENEVIVYIGQTYRDVYVRRREHVNNNETPFDEQFTHEGQYKLVVLEEKTFDYAPGDRKFAIAECQDWMDKREISLIKHWNTYYGGWNSTKGGQGGGWLRMCYEAALKRRQRRYEQYTAMVKDLIKRGIDINVGWSGVEGIDDSHLLGHFFTLLRKRRIDFDEVPVPQELFDLINENGFLWDTQNLATHVAAVIFPTPLGDATKEIVMPVLGKFQIHHNNRCSSRAGGQRVPFSNNAMTEEEAWTCFNGHLTRLGFKPLDPDSLHQVRSPVSKCPGVSFKKGYKSKMWSAEIMINGKKEYLGGYDTEEQATEVYNDAAAKIKKNGQNTTYNGKPKFSNYRGVYKKGNRYQARFTFRKVVYVCGTYDTAEDAAKAYDNELFKHKGIKHNFPDE